MNHKPKSLIRSRAIAFCTCSIIVIGNYFSQNNSSYISGFYLLSTKLDSGLLFTKFFDSIYLQRTPFLTIKHFEDVNVSYSAGDYFNKIKLTVEGKNILEKVSEKYLNKKIAFIINDSLLSISIIRQNIPVGRISFTHPNPSKEMAAKYNKILRREMKVDTNIYEVKKKYLREENFDKIILYERSINGGEVRLSQNDKEFVCKDPVIIEELKRDVYFIDKENCTDKKSNILTLIYKHDELISIQPYCDSSQSNISNFKHKFKETKLHTESFPSKKELVERYKKLKQEGLCTSFETFPEEEYLVGDGQLTIRLSKNESLNDTIGNYGEMYVKELKKYFNSDKFTVYVKFGSMNEIPGEITSSVYGVVRCSRDFGLSFDINNFKKKTIFKTSETLGFKSDENITSVKNTNPNNTIFYRK